MPFGLACPLFLAPLGAVSNPQRPQGVSYTSGKDFSLSLGTLEINPWQEGLATPSKGKSAGSRAREVRRLECHPDLLLGG